MCTEYNDVPVCPHCKHTQRDEDQKKLLQNRLRRIEGQVRGLQSMLEQDAYCNDILIQSAAVDARAGCLLQRYFGAVGSCQRSVKFV